MICRPIGSPSLLKPHGSERAGSPVRLNGAVNLVNSRARATASPPRSGAGMGVVGSKQNIVILKEPFELAAQHRLRPAGQDIFESGECRSGLQALEHIRAEILGLRSQPVTMKSSRLALRDQRIELGSLVGARERHFSHMRP